MEYNENLLENPNNFQYSLLNPAAMKLLVNLQ